MPTPPGMVNVRLVLTRQKQKEIRMLAAMSGIPMSKYCSRLVDEAVESRKVFAEEGESGGVASALVIPNPSKE